MNVALFVLLFCSSLIALCIGTLATAFYVSVEAPLLEDYVETQCTILQHSTVYVDYRTRRSHQLGYRAVWLASYRCKSARGENELRVANLTDQGPFYSADEFETPALAMANLMERPVGSTIECWCLPQRMPSAVTEEGETNNAVMWEEPRILIPTSISGPAMGLLPLGVLGLLLGCFARRLKCCRSAPRSRFERDEALSGVRLAVR